MSGGTIIAVLALLIPILAIITREMRRWPRLDLEAAKRDVDIRRQFRAYDQIEHRVADIEAYVTSPEFQLNREIGRLAGKP